MLDQQLDELREGRDEMAKITREAQADAASATTRRGRRRGAAEVADLDAERGRHDADIRTVHAERARDDMDPGR